MLENDPTDEKLMLCVAQGDPVAFRLLLDRYSTKVYAFAWRLTGQKADAEDLTQEVFLKVWKNSVQWQPTARLSTWLYRVLYNLFIDTKRKQKPTDELSHTLESPQESAETKLMALDQTYAVTKALNSLPKRQKEAVILSYHQGFKAKEACHMMDLSLGAFESLLFRARQTLKDMLLKNEKEGTK